MSCGLTFFDNVVVSCKLWLKEDWRENWYFVGTWVPWILTKFLLEHVVILTNLSASIVSTVGSKLHKIYYLSINRLNLLKCGEHKDGCLSHAWLGLAQYVHTQHSLKINKKFTKVATVSRHVNHRYTVQRLPTAEKRLLRSTVHYSVAVLRNRDVYPGSWFIPIPDPKRNTKEGWKIICVIPLM